MKFRCIEIFQIGLHTYMLVIRWYGNALSNYFEIKTFILLCALYPSLVHDQK